MKVKRKEWEQFIPHPMEEVWRFFSAPDNLNEITPPDMTFTILSDLKGGQMYEGMIIQYEVSPLFGIPLQWVTEITHIRERMYFFVCCLLTFSRGICQITCYFMADQKPHSI